MKRRLLRGAATTIGFILVVVAVFALATVPWLWLIVGIFLAVLVCCGLIVYAISRIETTEDDDDWPAQPDWLD